MKPGLNDSNSVIIDRSFLNWEWYKNHCTSGLFVHCLLKANPETGSFKATLSSLANELGYSVQNVRTALKHLTSDGQITDKVVNKHRIITVCNYDKYLIAKSQLKAN